MDADNVDFAELDRHDSGVLRPRLRAAQRAGRPRARLSRRVVSTLKCRQESAARWSIRPTFSSTLIESIIEIDEQMTERYFEGKLPTDEEAVAADRRRGRGGQSDSDRLRVGQNGRGRARAARRSGAVLAAAGQNRASRQERGRARKCRSSVDPAGPLVAQIFKTRIDPFVHKLSFVRIFSGTIKKDDNVHVSGARKAVKLHQLLCGARSRNRRRSTRPRPARSWPWPRSKNCTPACRWAIWCCRRSNCRTPMVGLACHAQEPRRRRPNCRARCTRSPRKTARSCCTAIRKPRSW